MLENLTLVKADLLEMYQSKPEAVCPPGSGPHVSGACVAQLWFDERFTEILYDGQDYYGLSANGYVLLED